MQFELIERTKKFQKECGVKSNFICGVLEIEPAFFCRWKKGQKKMNDESYNSLDKFLNLKGY